MLPDDGGDDKKPTHDMAQPTTPVLLDKASREPRSAASVHENPSTAVAASAESESGHAEERNAPLTNSPASSATVVGRESVAPEDAVQTPLPGDPNEPHIWEDLIVAGAPDPDFVSPWLRELIKPIFGLSSLDEFNGFEVGGFTPKTGEYSFTMAIGAFSDLLALARPIFVRRSSDDYLQNCLVKLTVSQSCVRAQAYDFATFGETVLGLKEPAPDIEKEQPISFVVSFYDLCIAGAAVDGEVRMTYRPEQKRVDLMAGNFERPLVALPVEKFTDFGAAKIGAIDPTSRRPIDPALLRRAIQYVAPAVEEDHLLEWPSVLELRGGRMMGGNQRPSRFSPLPN